MTLVAERAATAAIGDSPSKVSSSGKKDIWELTQSPARNQALAEIRRDSVWRLARVASEHLDRLLWSLEHDDDAEVRAQCRAMVGYVKAVVALVHDLGSGS